MSEAKDLARQIIVILLRCLTLREAAFWCFFFAGMIFKMQLVKGRYIAHYVANVTIRSAEHTQQSASPRARARVCVFACVRACVRTCVRACVRVWVWLNGALDCGFTYPPYVILLDMCKQYIPRSPDQILHCLRT